MGRGRGIRSGAALVVAALLATAGGAAAATRGTTAPAGSSGGVTYPVPSGGLPILGHGYGNGIGLSQWGAYGAAAQGNLSAAQILDFYYPNTHTVRLSPTSPVRVELDASSDAAAWAGVAQAAGLSVTSGGTTTTLPATIHQHAVQAWRLRRSGSVLGLQYRTDTGWHDRSTPAVGSAASFRDTAAELSVTTIDTAARSYRGSLTVTVSGGKTYAVNAVGIDDYLLGVVPSEMPASWPQAALQAQAVAARSYATYQIRHPRSSLWDVYANTWDQVYGGASAETTATDQAVQATSGQVRYDSGGGVIFAAYGSADGGYTVAGTVAGQPVDYLPAQPDKWDNAIPNNASSWSATISRAALASAFPQVGSPTSITVNSRDGHGEWGGRILSLTVGGTNGSVDVSGSSFAYDLGLKQSWWAPQLPPGPVRQTVATPNRAGGSVTVRWRAPATAPGRAAVTGYDVTLQPGGTSVQTTATSVTVTGLPAVTSYAVTVQPTSAIGRGSAVTVSSAVQPVGGTEPPVTLSQRLFARHTAAAVVLTATGDLAGGVAGPVLAGAAGGPLLTVGRSLDAPTAQELRRVLPGGRTVYLVGGVSTSVAQRVRALGWRPVRLQGSAAADTAVAVADQILQLDKAGGRTAAGVVETDGRRPAQAASAAAAARQLGDVLLLTDGKRLPGSTSGWLRRHPRLREHRWAVGSGAVAADKGARAVTGRGLSGLSVAVAERFFGTADAAAVAGGGDVPDAIAAATSGGPVLLDADKRVVPPAVIGWLRAARARLSQVYLVGPRAWLPYSPAVTAVDAALLG